MFVVWVIASIGFDNIVLKVDTEIWQHSCNRKFGEERAVSC